MTLVQASAFAGVAAVDTRPHARTRMLQQLLTIAKDQAAAWEALTGVKVPPASGAHSISATSHKHDGTNGAIIPIPLFQEWIGATLKQSDSDTGAAYVPVHMNLFFAPAGVSRIRLMVFCDQPFQELSRVSVLSSSLVETDGPYSLYTMGDHVAGWLQGASVAGQGVLYRDLDVTAGALNVISIESWDGQTLNGWPIPDVAVHGYAGYPLVGIPHTVPAWEEPRVTSSEVYVPGVDQHLNGTADAAPFTSFDDGMFADLRAVSSYIVQSLALNEAVLYELLTGKPAGGNVTGHTNSVQWAGHTHGGGSTYASATAHELGDDIDHALGSWAYGVLRRSSLADTSRLQVHEGSAADWRGRILAPHLTTTGTTAQTVTRHPFRMPNAQSATVQGGSSRLRAAALLYYDNAKGGGMDVILDVESSDLALNGSDLTLSAGGGLEVLSGTLDYHGTGGVGVAGALDFLRVRLRHSSSPSSVPSGAVLSTCVYYDAA